MSAQTMRLVERMDHGPSIVEEAPTSVTPVALTQVACLGVWVVASCLLHDICPYHSETRRRAQCQKILPVED